MSSSPKSQVHALPHRLKVCISQQSRHGTICCAVTQVRKCIEELSDGAGTAVTESHIPSLSLGGNSPPDFCSAASSCSSVCFSPYFAPIWPKFLRPMKERKFPCLNKGTKRSFAVVADSVLRFGYGVVEDAEPPSIIRSGWNWS